MKIDRNYEGYKDPTAGGAIRRYMKKKTKKRYLYKGPDYKNVRHSQPLSQQIGKLECFKNIMKG